MARAGQPSAPPSFGAYVAAAHAAGRLVVQPRMGLSDPVEMRAGLMATKSAAATTAGTITVDSYTRLGQHEAARKALENGALLNGYPIVLRGPATTESVLQGVMDPDFPVQVRHGAPDPRAIVSALIAAGLDATEGGPVSYCLPYSRTPLDASITAWSAACRELAALAETGRRPHLETFGGCMLGQLCPPSMLVALSVLEACFFRHHGVTDVSLSYAQQTSPDQDFEAVNALARIAEERLGDIDWHIVVYAYMGVYPQTATGARLLLREAVRLAVRTGSARLIVKTASEASRIPTVAENVDTLEIAAASAEDLRRDAASHGTVVPAEGTVEREARALVDAVLELDPDVGRALLTAFRCGYLDIPFCLHPDNAGRTRAAIDSDGRLQWTALGALPISDITDINGAPPMQSTELMTALTYVRRRYDRESPRDPIPPVLRRHHEIRLHD
ncbi:methylaspartate mutase [Streptomyces sp. NPDC056660]|uniref:methylaspartate mutase n=1 Tax=Streptomyces sp. NPDC056660 TaxID=3345897 RepID=UPI0036CC1D4C